jgi:hypothetical protein
MIDTATIDRLDGQDVRDPSGSKIGSVSGVYLDDRTGLPEWITVATGLFGTKESFVPVRDAHLAEDGLHVPVTKDLVKDAPRIDPGQHLSPAEEQALYRYYGLQYGPLPPAPAGTVVEPVRDGGDQVAGPLDPPEAQRNVASPPEAKPLLRRYGA